MKKVHIVDCSDASLSVVFGNEIDEQLNRQTMAFANAVNENFSEKVIDVCPTYSSVNIMYDPVSINRKELKRKLKQLLKNEVTDSGSDKKSFIWKIPVCYGGKCGEDLEDTAALTGMSAEELVYTHSKTLYRIYMLGFLPGFAYLGGLDNKICAPRLKSPRLEIPDGSVGIGGNQTGIYPLASPGGWRLIGRTPVDVYNPKRTPAVLYSAGDYIKFEPVDYEDFLRIQKLIEKNSYKYEKEAYIG